jgi:hypothetical protein
MEPEAWADDADEWRIEGEVCIEEDFKHEFGGLVVLVAETCELFKELRSDVEGEHVKCGDPLIHVFPVFELYRKTCTFLRLREVLILLEDALI